MMNRKFVFACFNACLVSFIVIIVLAFWDFFVSYLVFNTWFWAFIVVGIFLEWEFYRWVQGSSFLQSIQAQKIYFVLGLTTHFFGYYLQALIPYLANSSSCPGCQQGYTDFFFVFIKGVQQLLTNPSELFTTNQYMECRRAPSILLYYYIYYSIPSPYNFLAQSLVTLYCNLGSCYIIFQICKLEKFKQLQVQGFIKSPFIIAGTYIIFFGFYFEYLLGDSYSIVAFFVLVGLYYFFKGIEHAGFFFLGVSFTFMMNTIVWIFFLILKRPFKQLLKNFIFAVIPMIPSIIMFIAWPKLIVDFVPCNIAAQGPLKNVNYWGTLSSNLSSLFGINIIYSALISVIILIPLTLLVINRWPLPFHDRLMIIVLATISIIPDFNGGNVVYIMVPYLFWLSMKSPDINIKIKVIPFVPTTIFLLWIVFPFISPFYIIPLIIMDYNLIKKIRQKSHQFNLLRTTS